MTKKSGKGDTKVYLSWAGFLKFFRKLAANPVFWKSITSGLIACLGEIIANYIKFKKSRTNKMIDIKRMIVFGMHGFVLTGPLFSWW